MNLPLDILSVRSQVLDELRLHIFFTPFAATWNDNSIMQLKEDMKTNQTSYLYGTFCSLLRNGFLQMQDFSSIISFELFKNLMKVYHELIGTKFLSDADFSRFCVDFSFQKEIANLIYDKLKAAASQLEVLENGESPYKKQLTNLSVYEVSLDEFDVKELEVTRLSMKMS